MLAKFRGAVQSWVADQQVSSQQKSNLRGYSDALGRMLLDMNLDPHELAALAAQQTSLGLDRTGVQSVHRDAFVHMSRAILADGVVTPEELHALERVSDGLGVTFEDLPSEHHHTYKVAKSCMLIQAGQLPSLPPGSTVIRQLPGEVVHGEIESQILDERVVAREYRGGSSGMSFRICKGVSYRFGGTRGQSVPIKAVVPIDRGALSITSKRVAFIGTKKSFAVEWPKVLAVEPLADGVHLSFQSRAQSATVQYIDSRFSEIMASLFWYYMH